MFIFLENTMRPLNVSLRTKKSTNYYTIKIGKVNIYLFILLKMPIKAQLIDFESLYINNQESFLYVI